MLLRLAQAIELSDYNIHTIRLERNSQTGNNTCKTSSLSEKNVESKYVDRKRGNGTFRSIFFSKYVDRKRGNRTFRSIVLSIFAYFGPFSPLIWTESRGNRTFRSIS